MKSRLLLAALCLFGITARAQTKPATTTPPAVVSLIEGITDKQFMPDTAFVALSKQDEAQLAKEPVANWGLAQESGGNMTYYNLVIGTLSYQLVITRPPKSAYPIATLLRYSTPKSKPEPLARGTLRPVEAGKPK